jgi:hypothetical protein
MFGFPDSAECPIDMSGNRITLDEFREGAESHLAEGGHFIPQAPAFSPVRLRVPRLPSLHAQVFDRALSSDEVRREYDTQRITVNKTTHRIKFENETESSVDVVIEPKE